VSTARSTEGVTAAPDLRLGDPHPLDCELEGYAWIPRMLDKARATLAGTAGDYQFGCPVDHTCMARLGVSPELVRELAAAHADDHAVLAELRRVGIPDARDAWFDGAAVEDELQEQGTYLRVRHRDALPEAPGGRAFTGADHDAGVSVLLIEAGPGDRESSHTHPTEEVMAVQDGLATLFLGAHQARIVRPGEVVRIPAGVAHHYENRGDGPLRAVCAHGAATVITEPA
jgi:quercetin dioxygenase-like cupin family protein